jgi:hypothetical protein
MYRSHPTTRHHTLWGQESLPQGVYTHIKLAGDVTRLLLCRQLHGATKGVRGRAYQAQRKGSGGQGVDRAAGHTFVSLLYAVYHVLYRCILYCIGWPSWSVLLLGCATALSAAAWWGSWQQGLVAVPARKWLQAAVHRGVHMLPLSRPRVVFWLTQAVASLLLPWQAAPLSHTHLVGGLRAGGCVHLSLSPGCATGRGRGCLAPPHALSTV